jgi:hypothetical protein
VKRPNYNVLNKAEMAVDEMLLIPELQRRRTYVAKIVGDELLMAQELRFRRTFVSSRVASRMGDVAGVYAATSLTFASWGLLFLPGVLFFGPAVKFVVGSTLANGEQSLHEFGPGKFIPEKGRRVYFGREHDLEASQPHHGIPQEAFHEDGTPATEEDEAPDPQDLAFA